MKVIKRHQPILAAAQRDDGIIRESGFNGWSYCTKSGTPLPRRGVEELISAGVLKGDNDSLLGDCSQVFRFRLGEAP